MNIIFIAPPGAGKGTCSTLLKEKYNFEHISAGEVLREEVASGSQLGLEIKAIIDKGNLVDNEMLKKLLKNRMKNFTKDKNFIMDGYPRKIAQLYDYKEILSELDIEFGKAIYLKLDKENSLKRALGRMNCPKCSKDYNKYSGYNVPKIENTCDNCNIELISRDDDNEEGFSKRYDNYINETAPVVEKLKEDGVLIEIDATMTPEEIFKEVEKNIGVLND